MPDQTQTPPGLPNSQARQTPYAVTPSGPFTEALTAPHYEGYKGSVSGYGGAGEAIANLADKFFSGMSKGRQAAFEKQQFERQGLQTDVDKTRKQIEGSNAPDEAKQKAFGILDGASIGQLYKDVHESKDDNPQIKLIKSAFDAFIGPNKPKKFKFGPGEIYQAINQAKELIHKPEYQPQTMMSNLDKKFQQTLVAKQAELGHKMTREEIMTDKDLAGMVTSADTLAQQMGIKGRPAAMSELLGSAHKSLTKEEQELHDADLAHKAAQTKKLEADADLSKRRPGSTAKRDAFQNASGEVFTQDAAGKFYDADGNLVDAEKAKNLTKIGTPKVDRRTSYRGKDGNIYEHSSLSGKFFLGEKEATPEEVKKAGLERIQDKAAMERAVVNQAGQNARKGERLDVSLSEQVAKITTTYDGKIAAASAGGNKPEAASLEKQKKAAIEALQGVRTAEPPASGKTKNPPTASPKTGAPPKKAAAGPPPAGKVSTADELAKKYGLQPQ